MSVRDWGDIEKAKILVIGHDPRLRNSDTIAEYCFFADYYFKQNITSSSEKRKYGLAKCTFEQILYLTGYKYCTEDIFLTNLCNEGLPHAPKGKVVLIPYEKAKNGLEHILYILEKGKIIPILHPKNYPLKGGFTCYQAKYDKVRNYFVVN